MYCFCKPHISEFRNTSSSRHFGHWTVALHPTTHVSFLSSTLYLSFPSGHNASNYTWLGTSHFSSFTLLLSCFHLYHTSWIEINPNDNVISVIVLYAHFLYLCRDVMRFSMLRSQASELLTLRMSPWVICSNQDFKLCLAACWFIALCWKEPLTHVYPHSFPNTSTWISQRYLRFSIYKNQAHDLDPQTGTHPVYHFRRNLTIISAAPQAITIAEYFLSVTSYILHVTSLPLPPQDCLQPYPSLGLHSYHLVSKTNAHWELGRCQALW